MAKRLQFAEQALRGGGVLAIAVKQALERAGVAGNVLANRITASWKGARGTLEQLAVWIAKNGW